MMGVVEVRMEKAAMGKVLKFRSKEFSKVNTTNMDQVIKNTQAGLRELRNTERELIYILGRLKKLKKRVKNCL